MRFLKDSNILTIHKIVNPQSLFGSNSIKLLEIYAKRIATITTIQTYCVNSSLHHHVEIVKGLHTDFSK